MSLAEGSMLNFFPSLIFTFSSINSLITSWRSGILWVLSMVSLERCSMSKLVMGSPLTMTTTCCALAGDGVATIKTTAMPPPRMSAESLLKNVTVMVIFAMLTDYESRSGRGTVLPAAYPTPILLKKPAAGRRRGLARVRKPICNMKA